MRFYILVILSILALFTACNNEEESPFIQGNTTREVKFCLGAETYSTDTRFEEGDQIGVYALKRGMAMSPANNYADNRKFIFDGNMFIPSSESDRIFSMGGEPLDFYAYHPYDDRISDATRLEFSIMSNQSDDQTLSDLLWARNVTSNINHPIPLRFEHKLSLVQVRFNSVLGKQPSSAYIYGINPAVSLNLQTGVTTTLNNKKQYNEMFLFENDGDSYTYRYLLPEQQISKGDSLFTFHVDRDIRVFKAVDNIILKPGVRNPFECALQYRIDVESQGGGNVYGDGVYNYGESVTVSGVPNQGYNFSGWFENDVLVSDQIEYTFTAQKDRKLTGKFDLDRIRKIIVRSSGGGSAEGDGDYPVGEICTVKAREYPSYYFLGWFENGSNISSTKDFSFEVTVNRELEARFHPYDVFVEVKFYGMGLGVDTKGPIAYGSAKVEAYYMKDGQKQTYFPGNAFSVYVSFGYTAANPSNGGNLGYMTCSKLQLRVNANSGYNLYRLFYWDNAIVSLNRMSDLNAILNMRIDRSADQSSRIYTFLDATVGFYREHPWEGPETNYSLIKTLANQRNGNY